MVAPSKEKFSVELPAMYADHHVVEVRRVLLALPGVEDVYASSCFGVVELSYDPGQVTTAQITAALEEAGYLGGLEVPVENGTPASTATGEPPFFRHTAVYEHLRTAVSFGQVVEYLGRPLWTCPGMGVIKNMEE